MLAKRSRNICETLFVSQNVTELRRKKLASFVKICPKPLIAKENDRNWRLFVYHHFCKSERLELHF